MTDDTDVLDVQSDGRKSRLGRPPVSGFNPDDIATVDERLAQFRADNPRAVWDVSYDVIDYFGEPAFVVTAKVWVIPTPRPEDEFIPGALAVRENPDAVGLALRTKNQNDTYDGLYPLETAQTVAIGRAIRWLGYGREVTDDHSTQTPGEAS